jgi:hypothetical protein
VTDSELLGITVQAEREEWTELDLSGTDLENYDRSSKKSCKMSLD